MIRDGCVGSRPSDTSVCRPAVYEATGYRLQMQQDHDATGIFGFTARGCKKDWAVLVNSCTGSFADLKEISYLGNFFHWAYPLELNL